LFENKEAKKLYPLRAGCREHVRSSGWGFWIAWRLLSIGAALNRPAISHASAIPDAASSIRGDHGPHDETQWFWRLA
jgi:hypothetical protein